MTQRNDKIGAYYKNKPLKIEVSTMEDFKKIGSYPDVPLIVSVLNDINEEKYEFGYEIEAIEYLIDRYDAQIIFFYSADQKDEIQKIHKEIVDLSQFLAYTGQRKQTRKEEYVMAMKPEISVKNLLMQAFLTGWERSDKSISQDEYLQSAIQVIEVLQVEPENVYAEEGLGLPDGDEVDHLDDLLRADGQWLYYGVEEENFFLIQWYPDKASAEAKLAELEALGDGKQYLVDLSLTRENSSAAENFGSSNPVQLRS